MKKQAKPVKELQGAKMRCNPLTSPRMQAGPLATVAASVIPGLLVTPAGHLKSGHVAGGKVLSVFCSTCSMLAIRPHDSSLGPQ